jgi:hypothetical protein
VLSDGTPKLDDCLDEYYKWDKISKGYSTIIKTSHSFDESNLKKALEENLEVVTEVVECQSNAKLVIDRVITNGSTLASGKCLIFKLLFSAPF